MTDTDEKVGSRGEYPTRLVANIFLVAGIAILLVSSLIEGDTLSRYLVGTVVEFLLAGLAILAMRIEGLSIKRTARLAWPASREILLAVAAAPGLWIVGVVLNIVSMVVLGYVTPVPPSQFPSTVPESLALMLATLVAAPLCEELMFRGYVQRAYERRRVWIGVVAGGLIFALYHLRFQGVAAITPVALALSLIAWRTGSLVPGIALHAAYNAIATVLLVTTSFLPMQITGALTGTLVCLGILLTPLSLAALVMLWNQTDPSPHSPVPQPRVWLRWAWLVPLVGLAGVYGYSAVTEVLIGRFPRVIFNDALDLERPAETWDDAVLWQYEVQNQLGDALGTASCSRSLQAGEALFSLSCTADHEGFSLSERFPFLDGMQGAGPMEPDGQNSPPWWPEDLPSLGSLTGAVPQSWQLSVAWDRTDLAVRTLTATTTTPDAAATTITYSRASEPGEIQVTSSAVTDTIALPSDSVLMAYEWAWRLSALPFEVAYGGETTFVVIEPDGSATAYDAFVNVRGGEPTWTPAGTFVAWKVIVSWEGEQGRERRQTAWYDAESPHTLVRFDDGSVSYVLATADPTPLPPETEAYAVLR